MGQLDQILARHEVVGVDTSPFIYLWERHPRYVNLAEELFQHLKQPQAHGVTSIITLIEVSIHPQRQGRPDLVEAYENALLHSQQVQLLSIDIALARKAVALRATYNIHTPDALQIAAARESGATLFVTNDRRLTKVREIEFLLFDDHTQ